MLKNKFQKSFFFQLFTFTVISFLIFAPFYAGAYIDQATGTEMVDPATIYEPAGVTGSNRPPSGPVAYGIGMTICVTAKAIGFSIGSLSEAAQAVISVPVGEKTSGIGVFSELYTSLDRCAVEVSNNKVIKWIGEAIEYAAMAALNALLANLTNQIIQCIQSYNEKTGECDDGKKGFVLDFNKFLEDAAQIAGAKFLNSLTGVNLCSITPRFKLKVALLPVPNFKTRAECTLNQIVDNIENFYADFRNGGWLAWKESLSPNNNAFGTYLMSLDQKMADEFAAMLKAEKEVSPGGMKATKKCLNPSGADPDSPNCAISTVTTPSGTVETAVNFTAISPVRTLELNLAATYSKLGPYSIYLTAISNALLNKVANVGLQALLGVVTQDDLNTPNPYQGLIDQVSENSGDFANSQATQAQASLLKTTLQNIDTFITETARPHYFDLITKTSNIKTWQDKIINDYWKNERFGDATVATLGPTVISTITTQTTSVTTFNVSHDKVGQATIEKTEITTTTNGDTTTTSVSYAILNKRNKIEDMDGIVSLYTQKNNALQLTQSQINPVEPPPGPKTLAQTAYDKITAYINTWDGTQGDTQAKTEMDAAVADLIQFFRDSNKWTPSSQSTTLQGVTDELIASYNQTTTNISKDQQDGVQATYDQYLTDVQDIYNSLVPSSIGE